MHQVIRQRLLTVEEAQKYQQACNQESMNFVKFFTRQENDYLGRSLWDLIHLDDNQLENQHNVIQILFPLFEPSHAVPDAPILTAEIVEEFRDNCLAKYNLQRAFWRFIDFYGFDQNTLVHDDSNNQWLTPGDHNYLRISRIISCMTILGLPSLSQVMYDAVTLVYNNPKYTDVIGSKTYQYWTEALNPPLDRARW